MKGAPPTTLAANIKSLRTHLNLKQEAFAEKVGASQHSVSKWETRGEVPMARSLARLAQFAGCSVDEFTDEPWAPPEPPIGSASRALAPDIPPTRVDDETVELLSLDLSFSMGPGTTIDDYVEETPVRFDLGLLRAITRAPPERLRLARGVGDSMFPTLHSSDRVLIDTTQRVLNLQDRIWAVSVYGAAAIKRLRNIGGGKVLVISDNREVENQEVAADDLILAGRVVWLGRDL